MPARSNRSQETIPERQLTPPEDRPTHPDEVSTAAPDTIDCAVCGDTTTPTDPPAVCSTECERKLGRSRPADDPRPPEEQEVDRMEAAMDAAAERGI
jgi:hypothetical protein